MHPVRCITSVCAGANQCACVEVTPSGKSPSKYPNIIMGIPKSDGGKLKTSSMASGMYPTTSIPNRQELTL